MMILFVSSRWAGAILTDWIQNHHHMTISSTCKDPFVVSRVLLGWWLLCKFSRHQRSKTFWMSRHLTWSWCKEGKVLVPGQTLGAHRLSLLPTSAHCEWLSFTMTRCFLCKFSRHWRSTSPLAKYIFTSPHLTWSWCKERKVLVPGQTLGAHRLSLLPTVSGSRLQWLVVSFLTKRQLFIKLNDSQ